MRAATVSRAERVGLHRAVLPVFPRRLRSTSSRTEMHSVHLQQVQFQSEVAGKVIRCRRESCCYISMFVLCSNFIVACGPLQARVLPLQGIRTAG